MINRLRTAFLSVATVAVSMIVLGSDARARSVPPRPQNYLRFLQRVGSTRNENEYLSDAEIQLPAEDLNILRHNPRPGPRRSSELPLSTIKS